MRTHVADLWAQAADLWAPSQAAYVSIRQHTSAYVSIRQHTCSRPLGSLSRSCPPAPASAFRHNRLAISSSSAALQAAYVSIRQHTSAYVSIRQHTSAYVSIRQHTSASATTALQYPALQTRVPVHVSKANVMQHCCTTSS
jgi:CYTH domain-containing protein